MLLLVKRLAALVATPLGHGIARVVDGEQFSVGVYVVHVVEKLFGDEGVFEKLIGRAVGYLHGFGFRRRFDMRGVNSRFELRQQVQRLQTDRIVSRTADDMETNLGFTGVGMSAVLLLVAPPRSGHQFVH